MNGMNRRTAAAEFSAAAVLRYRVGGHSSCGVSAGACSAEALRRALRRMRSSPLRVSGVQPQSASNPASSSADHAAASIESGSNTGSNAARRCSGARRL